jgi:hypothetical protein
MHIRKEIIQGVEYNFYNDIDYKIVLNHCKKGTDGFMYILIKDLEEETKKFERSSKINNILNNTPILTIDNINNSYISSYLYGSEDIDTFLSIIIDKIRRDYNNTKY